MEEGSSSWMQSLYEDAEPKNDSDTEHGPPEIIPARESDEFPDRLSKIQEPEELETFETTPMNEAPVSREESTIQEGTQEAGEPEWLKELHTAFPDIPLEMAVVSGVTAPEPVAPLSTGSEINQELPGWLAKAMSEQELPIYTDLKASEEEKQIPEATQSELPDWLAGLQPTETTRESEELSGIESVLISVGPLAGLANVLPAEPDISQIQKPPAQSIKLQISEKQITHAEILESIIKEEGIYHPTERKHVPKSSSAWRVVFAATFFLVILASLLLGGFEFALPEYSAEVLTTSQLIEGIPNGKPVLVAVDYEPALSGEMDAVLTPVIEQLMFKGAYLTLVSTVPTGPLQAERLLSVVNQQADYQYQGIDQYTNLGYIPGGATGLLGFAQSPQQITPVDLTGNFPWQSSALQNVSSLRDFAIVVIATEKPETARNWIEQVKPIMGSTPMVMVLSAQAGPVVRPYFESSPKQVEGLVVGLPDSVIYENLYQRTSTATTYWDTYSLGMLLAGAVILVGAIISALDFLVKGMRAASPKGSKA